jgi:hypothetical protein
MANWIAVCTAVLTPCLVAGCSGASTDDRAGGPSASCSEPASGACLGELEAGTYTTQSLRPQLTYTVPDGWANMDDTPGVFLLTPPGRDRAGVDAGTDDYLGVYHAAAVLAGDCTPETEPAVGLEPRAIVEALRDREGLETSPPRRIEVGGLNGLVVEIEAPMTGEEGCSVPDVGQVVPLIAGVGQADFGRVQMADMRTRLYVLAYREENVVVEVSDVEADRASFDFQSVVDSLRFAQE